MLTDSILPYWSAKENVEHINQLYGAQNACGAGHHNFLCRFSTLVPKILHLFRTTFSRISRMIPAAVTKESLEAIILLAALLSCPDVESNLSEMTVPHPDLIHIETDGSNYFNVLEERLLEVEKGTLHPHLFVVICPEEHEDFYFIVSKDGPLFLNNYLEGIKGIEAFDVLYKMYVVNNIAFPPLLNGFYLFVSRFMYASLESSTGPTA